MDEDVTVIVCSFAVEPRRKNAFGLLVELMM